MRRPHLHRRIMHRIRKRLKNIFARKEDGDEDEGCGCIILCMRCTAKKALEFGNYLPEVTIHTWTFKHFKQRKIQKHRKKKESSQYVV